LAQIAAESIEHIPQLTLEIKRLHLP